MTHAKAISMSETPKVEHKSASYRDCALQHESVRSFTQDELSVVHASKVICLIKIVIAKQDLPEMLVLCLVVLCTCLVTCLQRLESAHNIITNNASKQ
jgi:hypothetical protein